MSLLRDFIGLFFPRVCLACGNSLFKNEEVVCTKCRIHLPETGFHNMPDNLVMQSFWGRVELQGAAALFYYKKGGAVQNLIHQFKYHGHQEVGIHFGKYYGAQLKRSEKFADVDLIVPIPLHKKKLKKRGFNQAERFAYGLSESMKVDLVTDLVIRNVATSTQTRKSKYDRWENVSEIFSLNNPEQYTGKHILLVDDVITTGATMEACLQVLQQIPEIKLSVCSLGFPPK